MNSLGTVMNGLGLTFVLLAVVVVIMAWRLTGHRRPRFRDQVEQIRADGAEHRAEMTRLKEAAAARKAAAQHPVREAYYQKHPDRRPPEAGHGPG